LSSPGAVTPSFEFSCKSPVRGYLLVGREVE
jgi:hypothetical protein